MRLVRKKIKDELPVCSVYNFLFFILFLVANTAYSQANKDNSHLYNFDPPAYEEKCFNYFNDTATGVNNVNAFLLAKMTELMYLDRLDYQMRYFKNNCEVVDTIESSDWLRANCAVTDSNFQEIFVRRFEHYFDGIVETDKEHEQHVQEGDTGRYIRFKYINRTHTGHYRFLGYKYDSSLDPELMLISTPEMILLLFRGTDDVGKSEWAEWIGTDLKIAQMNAGGALVGTKIHTGFWQSFDLIRDELIAALKKFDVKNKRIWIAGHSLGGALSIVTGVYLRSLGLDVENVYAYACPLTIGNKAFHQKAEELLPDRVQRFEYFQDPVTLLWAAGFHYDYIGQRNWYDEEKNGHYKLYKNTQERTMVPGPLKLYPQIDTSDIKEARRIRQKQLNGLTPVGLKKLHYHSPNWYVKATYSQLTEEEKKHLPRVDDSYPYLYYYRKDAK